MLVFGEPGLEKDNIAVLIHFSSPQHERPMVQILSLSSYALASVTSCCPSLMAPGTMISQATQLSAA